MVRPIKPRFLRGKPKVVYFKPKGIPLRDLEEIVLEADEFEAIKLHDCDGLNQTESSKRMRISQPTFARILDRAYKKIAHALVEGKAIRIEKNNEVSAMGKCGSGRGRRDGTGPRAQKGECPYVNEDKQDGMLKRDGTGPNKDGCGPRCSNIGPREDCPKRK